MENAVNLQLGVTTIGDLLVHKKISQSHNGSSLEDVELRIPDYQRPYKWTARNSIQLLDDIIEARNNNKEVYRVGTLILHREKNNDGKTIYNIVDGQQRTITFSLLLSALHELDTKEEGFKIDLLEQEVFDNAFSRHNIPNNLNAFKRRVYKENREENIDFIRDMKRLRTT